jgi:hypothetical protein
MKKIFTLFAALAMVMSMSAKPYLRGSFNGWGTTNEFVDGRCVVTLAANTTYQFKVDANGDWTTSYGNEGTITDNVTDWVFDKDANCTLKTQAAGEYTFTWNDNGHKLSVAYPALAPAVYKDITITVNIPYQMAAHTPKIYWWGADGVADAVWGEATEMEASPWNTMKFSYTFEQIDSVRGINYLIICDGVQTKDLYTHEDATVWFQSSMPTVKVMGIAGDWTTGVTMTANPGNANEYVLLGQKISEGDAVKVVTLTDGAATAWCGNVDEYSVEHSADDMGNIVLAPGAYDFYYKVDADQVYIEKSSSTSIDNVMVDVKASKIIRNGQMYILRDGVLYNAIGQIAE